MQIAAMQHEEQLIQERVREIVGRKHDAYEKIWFNPGYIYRIQELERSVLAALKRTGHTDLDNLTMLDIGCGSAHWAREFVNWGAPPEHLFGVDLMPERVDAARRLCAPGVRIDCGSALELHHEDRSIDVVMLFGVMCLIADSKVRRGIVSEAVRVLKDDGIILWCDYRFTAPGEKTLGTFNKHKLRELFKGMRIEGHAIHPLPPLLRKIGPYAPFMCNVIAMLPFIRTHYFATITKDRR